MVLEQAYASIPELDWLNAPFCGRLLLQDDSPIEPHALPRRAAGIAADNLLNFCPFQGIFLRKRSPITVRLICAHATSASADEHGMALNGLGEPGRSRLTANTSFIREFVLCSTLSPSA